MSGEVTSTYNCNYRFKHTGVHLLAIRIGKKKKNKPKGNPRRVYCPWITISYTAERPELKGVQIFAELTSVGDNNVPTWWWSWWPVELRGDKDGAGVLGLTVRRQITEW